ncbi:MAG: PAS domain S-box protein, partial [bacterium]|nr:PAS domain S-box protein [bacterium]
ATERLFGYHGSELLGKNPILLNAESNADSMQQQIFHTIGQGQVWTGEILNKKKSGEVFPIYASAYQLQDEEGQILATIGFQQDITERKQAETEKEKLEGQLRQSHKMEAIGTLAGGIAHDFNNILGIIVGNTELSLRDVPEWNPAHQHLEEVQKACLRARDVVRQLLGFSRKSEQQKKPLKIAP